MSEEFRRFCEGLGFQVGDPQPTNRAVRFNVGKKRDKSGWYMLDEKGGIVGNWKTGERHKWWPDKHAESYDRAAINKAREDRLAKTRRQQAVATRAARARWDNALPINGASHPYLEAKSVPPCGARVDGEVMVIPVYGPDDQLMSVQTIAPDGTKRFQHLASMDGGWCPVGPLTNPNSPLTLCEGFATGATMLFVIQGEVICAFNADNLVKVARWARKKWPERDIVIAGDDDRFTYDKRTGELINPGRIAANKAAKDIGATAIFPEFADGDEGTDFNDMMATQGIDAVMECVDRQTLLTVAPVNTPDNLLPFEWFADIRPSLDGNWLVEDLLSAGGLSLIYGHPGCGKSFFALDITMHIAAGNRWRDKDVTQGLIVYVGAEGQRGLRNRITAFRHHHGIADLPFALIPVEVDMLTQDGESEKLADTVRHLSERYDLPIAGIVFDTLSRTFGGGDEVGSDMVSYINNVGRLQTQFQCSAIVIHHRPKDSENKTPRGHGSLWGACDTVILVEDKGEIKTATVTKQKDADPGAPVAFKLEVIDLGEDNKGKPVSSCVVVHETGNIMAGNTSATSRFTTPGQRIAYDALLYAIYHSGHRPPDSIVDNDAEQGKIDRTVTLEKWRERTVALLCEADTTPDSANRNFRRYKEWMQSRNIIGVYKEWVWVK